MVKPLLFLTGFGPFEDVPENPSEFVAQGLSSELADELDVDCTVLPVSFERSRRLIEARLEALGDRRPAMLLALGVHRGSRYRVEVNARPRSPKHARPDNDGVSAAEAHAWEGPDLRTGLEPELRRFIEAEEAFYLSEDAGGYVCEHVYRAHLEAGVRLERPALFVHVPHLEHRGLATQVADLGRLVRALLVV